MKRTPLKRKTGLKRTGKLRVRSKKRQKEEGQYNKRVKEWKLENPFCLACHRIFPADPPSRPTRDCHHMAGKEGKLLLDESWWLPVCRSCHNWIGDHANWARELGLLAPKNM